MNPGTLRKSVLAAALFVFACGAGGGRGRARPLENDAGPAGAGKKPISLGMIGLDTSHVIAFTRRINDPEHPTGCRVTAAYPGGSPDVKASAGRVAGFTRRMAEEFGVTMVGSIEALLARVDGVLLMSVDGRTHLAQARPVIAAGKALFIDKPFAAGLAEGMEIFRLAAEAGVPCWSASALRFCPGVTGLRHDERVGRVLGVDAYSPCHLEPHHPDLYWYGIHGVEILFTLMGPGCRTVQRTHTPDGDVVTGVWKDGRIGTFRGLRAGKLDYGALVFGAEGIARTGPFTGYDGLVEEIVKFFKTGKAPVAPEETLEILAFMTAADRSKERQGAPVALDEVFREAGKGAPPPRPREPPGPRERRRSESDRPGM